MTIRVILSSNSPSDIDLSYLLPSRLALCDLWIIENQICSIFENIAFMENKGSHLYESRLDVLMFCELLK